MAKYPRFGGDRKYDGWTLTPPYLFDRIRECECLGCKQDVTHVVDIQVNSFRGHGEVYYVCPRHVGMARHYNQFQEFLKLIDEKGQGNDSH